MNIFDEIKILRLETFKKVLDGAKNGLFKQQLVDSLGTNTKTIERYVNNLRDIGIAVESNGRPVKYSINYTQSEGLQLFEYILDRQILSAYLLNVVNTKDTSKRHLFEYVDFEHHDEFKGIKYFDQLFSAIANNNTIRFSYKSYYTNREKEVTINPFLLKEYQYRWYVAGIKDDDEIRSYGLDRITSEIYYTGEQFELPITFDRKQIYNSTIGVTISKLHKTIKPVEIIFEINTTLAKHAQSLKIHPSQKILTSHSPDVVRFSIFTRPNFEMWHTFLQYIPHIKIVSPEQIKLEFLELLKNAINNTQ